MSETKYKRPGDISYFRTSDPKEMLGKYLPSAVMKTYDEDFVDEDTGETVSIERNEVICEGGEITQGKLQTIMFAIQSGDIKDVEVCEDDVPKMDTTEPAYPLRWLVSLWRYNASSTVIKEVYLLYATSVQHAAQIIAEYGNVYLGFRALPHITKVAQVDATIIEDDDACIPEDERTGPLDRKDYFRVTVRSEYFDAAELKEVTNDRNYIINANEVGQAKERALRKVENDRAEREEKYGPDSYPIEYTVRKAIPFKVDWVIPIEYTKLFLDEKETK